MLRRTWVFLPRLDAVRPAPIGAWRPLAWITPVMMLAACTTGPLAGLSLGLGSTAGSSAQGQPMGQLVQVPPGNRIGILLPLSGNNAPLGQAMLRSAQLAVAEPGAPPLDPQDTELPGGGTRAAQAALNAGDGILLGPLTSVNTAQAAPVARAAGIPMLAFTSDVAQAQPGVWVMGVTPEQQVRRLVFAAKAEGRTRMAALLPGNALGNAMAQGLMHACADAGLPAPQLVQHSGSMESVNSAMRSLADFANRRGAIEQKIKDAKASQDPEVRGQLDALSHAPIPPPPFDALLLADTGVELQEVISVLNYYDVSPQIVRIMGPLLWGAFASKLAALEGAWFAGPDSADRLGFVQRYQARYGQPPRPLADIPYDGAALARSLGASGGYTMEALTRGEGFAGVDGLFTLLPDGHVRRGLAIFQVQPGGGARIVQPAPKTLDDTTS